MKYRFVGALSALLLSLALPPASAQEGLAATVNGEKITLGEWASRMQSLRAQDFVASVNPLRLRPGTAGQIALESLINGKLLLQYAARTSLLPSEAEVEAELQNLRQQPAIAQALERNTLTEAQLREQIRFDRAAYNVATINQTISAQEVKAFYDRRPELFGRPEAWRLARIRTTSRAALEKVQAELKKGTPFATVAAQLSEDSEEIKKRGGEIGLIVATDANLPAYVREAVQKLKVGEVTPPLQPAPGAAGGTDSKTVFILIRLLEKQEANIQPFEQAKPRAERLALYEKVGGPAALEKKLEEFRKSARIEIHLPEYKDLFKQQP